MIRFEMHGDNIACFVGDTLKAQVNNLGCLGVPNNGESPFHWELLGENGIVDASDNDAAFRICQSLADAWVFARRLPDLLDW